MPSPFYIIIPISYYSNIVSFITHRQEKAEELFSMMQNSVTSDYGMIRAAIDVTSIDENLWCHQRSSSTSPMSVDSPSDLLKPSPCSPSLPGVGQTLNSVQSSSSSGYSSSCEDDLISPMSTMADNCTVFDDVSLLLQQHDFGPVNMGSPSSGSTASSTNLASPRIQEEPAVPVAIQAMEDLCTDNISFDDLVSTDDWLDSLNATTSLDPLQSVSSCNAMQSNPLEQKSADSFLLDSYLEPSSDLWSTDGPGGFPEMQSMMLDPLSRSPLEDSISAAKTANLPDHTLEVSSTLHIYLYLYSIIKFIKFHLIIK